MRTDDPKSHSPAKAAKSLRSKGRGPAPFKEADITRAIKAARKAGLEVGRVEVDKEGKIIVIAGKPTEAALERNALDNWIAKHAHET